MSKRRDERSYSITSYHCEALLCARAFHTSYHVIFHQPWGWVLLRLAALTVAETETGVGVG